MTTKHRDFEDIPIRSDLLDAFRATWEHIARPGSGWSGAERVAIAGEARRAANCPLCLARKEALSPNAVSGEHDRGDTLPPAAVEAAHRVATDAGRLTERFYDETLVAGLSDLHWTELVGVVASVTCMDTFHRAIGRALDPLPDPHPGAATGYRPKGAAAHGGWGPTIREKDLDAAEKDIYGGMPRTGNVIRALSLVPDEVRNLLRSETAMYMSTREVADFSASGGRAIDRMQIELVASRVSSVNECYY